MRLRCRKLLLFAAALALAAPGVAQKPTTKPDSDDFQKGFTEFETFQGEANSDSKVLKLDSTVGYDFNKHFGVFAGVPVYFSHVSSSTTSTTTTSSGGTGVGNVYLGFALRAPNPTLDYSSTVTAGAPTGDTKKGLSTGRASIDWDNRFEHSFDRLTPFFDGGLANTVPDSVFLTRPFTSLGAITHLEEGADFDLVRHFSVGGSAYQIVPFGNQKLVSRLVRRGQSGRGGRVFDAAASASGSGLTRENGFSTWVGFEPTSILRAEIGYTRSTTFDLNSFAFNLRVNFGKLLRPRKTS
ncbi:MAG TPA: hypothetical protein VKE93_21170 [Candidatus Angelobacter sp.]|nr:hypothetical protein [Candidatus Angelobacter sp.]